MRRRCHRCIARAALIAALLQANAFAQADAASNPTSSNQTPTDETTTNQATTNPTTTNETITNQTATNENTTDETTANQTTPDCSPSNRGMAQMERARIALTDSLGARIDLNVLIADDDLERASGYQYICPQVIARTAILFRYAAPSAGAFHMRNVKAPLDIAFFDRDGVLIQAMRMQPYADGESTVYAPMQSFQYALETRAGFFAERGLLAGASKLLLHTLP